MVSKEDKKMEASIKVKQFLMLSTTLRLGSSHVMAAWRNHGNVIARSISSITTSRQKKKMRESEKSKKLAEVALKKEKRRTRSSKQYVDDRFYESSDLSSSSPHVPVMLGEVAEVFSSMSISSFVDCTLGAGGHASAIIKGHPELKLFIGMDVDPVAHEAASTRLDTLVQPPSKAFTFVENFKSTKVVLARVDPQLLSSGVDGILMDLGMSSMQVNNPARGFSWLREGPLDMRMDPQASLKAEDILNSWPETEVGRILRDYGEESNWRLFQTKIVRARLTGGLHSTGDLVNLIRNASPGTRGGRQGWIKTATRVFQGLRIAVNDELKTLENSLHASFDCLAPGGRLAVISFHSLEDRIVKQTFLGIINSQSKDEVPFEEGEGGRYFKKTTSGSNENEKWIKQTIQGLNGTILTKRPITPSEEEEKLNSRSRSAKLRVIQKV